MLLWRNIGKIEENNSFASPRLVYLINRKTKDLWLFALLIFIKIKQQFIKVNVGQKLAETWFCQDLAFEWLLAWKLLPFWVKSTFARN